MRSCAVRVALFLFLIVTAASGQTEPTMNVLTRMTVVKSQHGVGTVFSIDVDQREYWITAKHMLTGAKHPPYGTVGASSTSLEFLDTRVEKAKWVPEDFGVIDPGENIDIVVLAPRIPILKDPLPSLSGGFAGAALGGECEFLGYPTARPTEYGQQTSTTVTSPGCRSLSIATFLPCQTTQIRQ